MGLPRWERPGRFGAVGSASFSEALDRLGGEVAQLEARAGRLGEGPGEPGDAVADLLRAHEAALVRLWELLTTAWCAEAADGGDRAASAAHQRAMALLTRIEIVESALATHLRGLDDGAFARLLGHPGLAGAAAWFGEIRAQRALPEGEEALERTLRRESQLGWSDLYRRLEASMRAEAVIGGTSRAWGMAELLSLQDDPRPEIRREAHRARSGAFAGAAELCALCLTHLVGARQTRLARLGSAPLEPSLESNRISAETVGAMWEAAEVVRPVLHRYLRAKAGLFGATALDWADLRAEVGQARPWPWEEALEVVFEAFDAQLPPMGALARRAVEGGWLDAEPRDGKGVGAACGFLPLSRESRVLLSYTPSASSAQYLAHELGHAYHNEILADQPVCRRRITAALAETASLVGETVVRDRLLERAATEQERLFALDRVLAAACTQLLDIRARFAFELGLYERRSRGPLSPEALDAWMGACLEEVYGEAVAGIDEGFWRTKRHFYGSREAFNSWPYTFGYVFAALILARRGEADFPALHREVLLRTGWQDGEGIAREVLGIDLRDPGVWREAFEPLETQVAAFEALVGSHIEQTIG